MNQLLRRLPAVALVTLLLAGALLRPTAGQANGVPIRIQLSYLQGLSNFGPESASGQAELSYSEGLLNLTAQGLAPLDGDRYGVWLVKSASNTAMNVGVFAADSAGAATFDGKLGALSSYDYDLVILTVQAGGAVDAGPSAKRSIGGFFTPVQAPQVTATGTSTETQPETQPGTQPQAQPATLPLTGYPPAPAEPRILGFRRHDAGVVLLLSGAGILAITILRRRVRRA